MISFKESFFAHLKIGNQGSRVVASGAEEAIDILCDGQEPYSKARPLVGVLVGFCHLFLTGCLGFLRR